MGWETPPKSCPLTSTRTLWHARIPPPRHTAKYINKPIAITNFNGQLGLLVNRCNSALRRLRQGWKLEASLIYKLRACLTNSQTRNKIGRQTNRDVGPWYCSPSMHESLCLVTSSGLRKELTEGTNSLALKKNSHILPFTTYTPICRDTYSLTFPSIA